ncbi:MAG: NAD(P)H-dependent oxidoreductase [Solobacterium sp.]|nr:NAD(P)H-dependent oxidoreductase [Solobacterium sp.]
MRIALITASPRNESVSRKLLEMLETYLKGHETAFFSISVYNDLRALAARLDEYEALVFSLPLYFDGIPSGMLQLMANLEAEHTGTHRVGVIVNCGFHEAEHASCALKIMHIWADRLGAEWIAGASFGGGPLLEGADPSSAGRGIYKRCGAVFETFREGLKKSQKDMYVPPVLPRFLYMQAAMYSWRSQIRKNGLTSRDLNNRLTDE